MRKSLLVLLVVLFVAPILASCAPYWHGYGNYGYGGYYDPGDYGYGGYYGPYYAYPGYRGYYGPYHGYRGYHGPYRPYHGYPGYRGYR
jgi:hypothetical protein